MPARVPVDLSIAVVSTNQRSLIASYLPSLFGVPDHATYEIALIDNACTDGTAEWVRHEWPQVQIIRHERPQSYAANMNLGMHTLQAGRYFLVLNPDIECLPGLLDGLVAFMDANPEIGLAGPQLLNPDGTLQWSSRSFSTPFVTLLRGLHVDGVLRRFSAVRRYLILDQDHSCVVDVDWVVGALMIVRREAVALVGGMDERYDVTYSEDQDWCCSMWQAGWRVCYVPQARAIHDHQRLGMRRPWNRMARIQTLNAIRMFRKFGWRLTRDRAPVSQER